MFKSEINPSFTKDKKMKIHNSYDELKIIIF